MPVDDEEYAAMQAALEQVKRQTQELKDKIAESKRSTTSSFHTSTANTANYHSGNSNSSFIGQHPLLGNNHSHLDPFAKVNRDPNRAKMGGNKEEYRFIPKPPDNQYRPGQGPMTEHEKRMLLMPPVVHKREDGTDALSSANSREVSAYGKWLIEEGYNNHIPVTKNNFPPPQSGYQAPNITPYQKKWEPPTNYEIYNNIYFKEHPLPRASIPQGKAYVPKTSRYHENGLDSAPSDTDTDRSQVNYFKNPYQSSFPIGSSNNNSISPSPAHSQYGGTVGNLNYQKPSTWNHLDSETESVSTDYEKGDISQQSITFYNPRKR